jgi:hypothetical protein
MKTAKESYKGMKYSRISVKHKVADKSRSEPMFVEYHLLRHEYLACIRLVFDAQIKSSINCLSSVILLIIKI